MSNLLSAALTYRAAGLLAIPAKLERKNPYFYSWGEFAKTPPDEAKLAELFAHPDATAICIPCGPCSGNLELIDFDDIGSAFPAWRGIVEQHRPGLFDTLVVERSPSGGFHVFYRVETWPQVSQFGVTKAVSSLKLATAVMPVNAPGEYERNGKRTAAVQTAQGLECYFGLIETRGAGGLVLCDPSPGYQILQGDLCNLPVLQMEERDFLIEAARALNEKTKPAEYGTSLTGQNPAVDRPGDDFNRTGDITPLLEAHGWHQCGQRGDNQDWTRPGKTHGLSATWHRIHRKFYVFTSSTPPFEPNSAYSAFAVMAYLNHGGDFKAAARALAPTVAQSALPPIQSQHEGELTPDESRKIYDLVDLLDYNTDNDETTLLGQRYLCKAGSCVFIGQTGIGKSSLTTQAMISWAFGEPHFGIAPTKPLRSLVVQAENDAGDLSEMIRGVVNGTNCGAKIQTIRDMIKFIPESAISGDSFMPYVHSLITQYKPDLVWIDPLLAFLGGDINKQEVVSKFLRNGLGKIAQETGVCWMIIHHANKPRQETPGYTQPVSDYSYMGAGSAEIANWARAVCTLKEKTPGVYEFRTAKRGKRAGLVDHLGKRTDAIMLQHATDGRIFWERAQGMEDVKAANEQMRVDAVLDGMTPNQIYKKSEIVVIVAKVFGIKVDSVYKDSCPANRVLHRIFSLTAISASPGFYRRKPECTMRTDGTDGY